MIGAVNSRMRNRLMGRRWRWFDSSGNRRWIAGFGMGCWLDGIVMRGCWGWSVGLAGVCMLLNELLELWVSGLVGDAVGVISIDSSVFPFSFDDGVSSIVWGKTEMGREIDVLGIILCWRIMGVCRLLRNHLHVRPAQILSDCFGDRWRSTCYWNHWQLYSFTKWFQSRTSTGLDHYGSISGFYRFLVAINLGFINICKLLSLRIYVLLVGCFLSLGRFLLVVCLLSTVRALIVMILVGDMDLVVPIGSWCLCGLGGILREFEWWGRFLALDVLVPRMILPVLQIVSPRWPYQEERWDGWRLGHQKLRHENDIKILENGHSLPRHCRYSDFSI